MARSTEAAPPPEISSARQIATRARGYSIPPGAKKPGQCFAAIAVAIVQRMKKAPTLVNKPKKIKMPPINSENAAAPSHSQAGLMKLKGAGIEIHFSKPGPLKLPNTFCAPWATNMAAIASRKGSGIQVAEVEINLLNMISALSTKLQNGADINGQCAGSKAPLIGGVKCCTALVQICVASREAIACFGCAPMIRSTSFPFLKISMVGIL